MVHAIRVEQAEYVSVLNNLRAQLVVDGALDIKIGDKVKVAEYIRAHGFTDRELVFTVSAVHRESPTSPYQLLRLQYIPGAEL